MTPDRSVAFLTLAECPPWLRARRGDAGAHVLDRREFIRAGLLLAAAAGAGFPRLGAPAVAATAAAPALSPGRQASFQALLGALREAPGGRFRHRDAAAGTRAFADWYAAQPPAMRLHADTVVDAVGELIGTRGTAARRYATLRDRPGGASPSPAEAHRRAVLMAAVALAEGPDAAGTERAPTEALA